ncbi:MAG: hypothetical protein M1818_006499 [Claussenomyces sp. TS43310]|nr:MAG: hypothetical protein M1818_006499 [Claussenomyces sp. TS43310]
MAPTSTFALPAPYRLFFLTIEPLSALVGAFYACLKPQTYLYLTQHLSAHPSPSDDTTHLPLATRIVLTQLANLYLLFALHEALVLRATSDLRVWRTVLALLLVADLGHLASVAPLGSSIYWNLARWNPIDWGNVGFVYVGAAMRLAFLAGVGMKR